MANPGKLTKYITRQVIDRSLQSIKQALDDFPHPTTAEDHVVHAECRQLLLGYRAQLREDRDKLTGLQDQVVAYLLDDPDVK